MKLSKDLIFNLPKTDLHCHLDGSLRIDTVIELARSQKVNLPSFNAKELIETFGYNKIRTNLNDYLLGFSPLIQVLQDEESLERVAFELAEDAVFENIWHLEMRYCPYLNQEKGLSMEQVVKAVTRGIKRAQEKYRISVGQILCGLKHDSPEKIFAVAKLACKLKDEGVVGFDLAGPEVGYDLDQYTKQTDYVLDNLINITIHAGENTPASMIHQAISKTNASRIGHGTSLFHDKKLMNYVVDQRIAIETCPTSNIHTASVKNIQEHPLKIFLDNDVRVCVNTDNRLVSYTNMTQELFLVAKTFELSAFELKKLIKNGFEAAFMPYKQKSAMIEKFSEVFDGALKFI